ncbi:MAG: hypothetical protein JNM56_24190 [Planctomycetia bacterium]|nr:hypothetical protein [Planctomycetia bacterium]
MKRTVGALLTSIAACCWFGPLDAEGQAPPNKTAAPALRGVPSCASSACHHQNGPRGSVGSEYTSWLAYDPHARAFHALSSERSRQIVYNLKEAKFVSPDKHPLCLSCHATATEDSADRKVLRVDGVGCESCHGPASNWLTEHTTPAWKQRSAAEKQSLGFRPLKDLTVRAQTCVGCHVGAGDRDVNHDLIAAGHPRLNFEFGAYHANCPKHWREQQDKAGRADFEARVWAIGQVVAAEASLRLLQHRAATAGKPWPEFAEYDCYSCHHDLAGQAWRRDKQAAPGRPGALVWNRWYQPTELLEPLGLQLPTQTWQELQQLMQQPSPNRAAVARRAQETADQLAAQLPRLNGIGFDRLRLDGLLKGLHGRAKDRGAGSWDQAAQQYLALAALHQARQDLGEPASEVLREFLKELFERLTFPPGYNSPRPVTPKR